MKKLDLSRLNVFLDFIQNTHQYTELGWVHEATDVMYKKVSKLFDTFRESFAGLTEMEDAVKTDIPTPDPVADSVVRKVLREKIDEICDYLYDIADEESFLISQVDEIKTVLLQQYYVALKK